MRALSGLVGGNAVPPSRIGALSLIKLKGVCGRASMRGPGDGIFRAIAGDCFISPISISGSAVGGKLSSGAHGPLQIPKEGAYGRIVLPGRKSGR